MNIEPHVNPTRGVLTLDNDIERDLLMDGTQPDRPGVLIGIRGILLGIKITTDIGLGEFPRTTNLSDEQILRIARNLGTYASLPGELPQVTATRKTMIDQMNRWVHG